MNSPILIALIRELEGLTETEQRQWIARIKKDGITDALLENFEIMLSEKIEKEFFQIGFPEKLYAPEVHAIRAAFKQFAKKLEKIKKDIDRNIVETLKTCDAFISHDIRKHMHDKNGADGTAE